MKTHYTLKFHKPTQLGWFVMCILLLPFLLGVLNEFLGLPWALRYVIDLVWLVLLAVMAFRRRNQGKKVSILLLWILLFVAYSAISYLPLYQSAMYYLWGVRNNFRFFVAFFAFIAILKPRNVEDYFKLFDILFWINMIVSLLQYFYFEISGDHLGGIFGSETGANAYTNIFFLILLTKDILLYLEKREKLAKLMIRLAAMLILAALAEIKFFFVGIIFVFALSILFTRFTWRKLWVILGGLVLISAGVAILVLVYPDSEGFLSLEFLLEVTTSDKGYTSTGDLNRLNAISRINELWLKTPWQRLFGLGLGNCDTSSFDFLNTPFYEAYGTMHYTWISYAMMYLECGWIGLIFYFGFFVLVYLSIRRIEKRCSGVATTYCRMGRILALMCMIIAIYNSSLRTEAGYMMYFALSVPFVMRRDQIGAARRGEKK